jgi:hypothetical protein
MFSMSRDPFVRGERPRVSMTFDVRMLALSRESWQAVAAAPFKIENNGAGDVSSAPSGACGALIRG